MPNPRPPAPDNDPERDLALVRAVAAGERGALDQLIQRLKCVPRIVAVINSRRGRLLSPHDAEDLTQDVLARIWEKLETFRGHTTLEFWAHQFCFLEFMNRVRSRSRASMWIEKNLSDEDTPADPRPAEPTIEPDALEQALAALDPDARGVIEQKAFEQKPFEEIGKALGVPAATAKSRYYRALAELRRRLASDRMGGSQ